MERPAGRHERARRRLDTNVLREQSGNSRYDDTGVRITEDERVHIPVNVCYDGFYSSHLMEGLEVPTQEAVDAFLPAYNGCAYLDPGHPQALDPLTPGELMMHYRKSHLDAMQSALDVIDEVDAEFYKSFGRSYGGCIEEYLCDDADVVLITVGGMSGTGKDAVDAARENGIRAGLIKLRFVRPFPAFRITNALKGKRAFAVVDRSVCFGWNAGPMYMETCAALADASDEYCHFSAIGGLGGADLSFEHMLSCIEKLEQAKSKPGAKETLWLMND